jgi:peptidoglycan/LPS O-acetylase OafA/YrhL
MDQSRQSHLDSLRGIAALIVVVNHYFAAFYPYTVFGSQGNYQQHSEWENILFFPPFGLLVAGRFAACLFFILSGYVLSYSHLGEACRSKKILAAIVKRPIRLGGLVWFTILMSFLLWYFGLYFNSIVANITSSKPWFSHYWAGNFDFHQLIVTLATATFSGGVAYNPPLWTIDIELYGSFMVYIFVLLLGNFKYRLLISSLLTILFKDSFYQGFWIGLFAADLVKNHTLLSNPKGYFSIFLTVLFLYLSSYPNHVNFELRNATIYKFLPGNIGCKGGYAMLSALLLFILVITNKRVKAYLCKPFFQFLGKISYAMYAVHFLIIGSLSSWIFLNLNEYASYVFSFIVVLLSGVPVVVFISFLATKYIDNPSIKLADFISKKTLAFVNLLPVEKLLLRAKKLTTRCT